MLKAGKPHGNLVEGARILVGPCQVRFDAYAIIQPPILAGTVLRGD